MNENNNRVKASNSAVKSGTIKKAEESFSHSPRKKEVIKFNMKVKLIKKVGRKQNVISE